MTPGRSLASRPFGSVITVLLGGLLLLGGCAATGTHDSGGGGGEAGQATSPVRASPVRPAPPPATSTTVGDGVRQPVVPQHRATLPPLETPRPVPARFAAASIGVDLPVVQTGVAEDGRMELPETNRAVAWYGFGSRPGDPVGTTVLAAHVDTRSEGLGPFVRLRELRRGAELAVTDASGSTRRYLVTAVDDVPKSQVSVDQLFRRDGPPALTVLTCGGPFSRQTGYRDNIVVTAHPR